MDADRIVADPLSVTGSIGVVQAKPVIARLLEKKQVHREVFKKGEYSDMFSINRPMTEAEGRQVGSEIEQVYKLFVDGVAAGRKMTPDQVRSVSGGRVWMGSQAAGNGLVDSLGTLDQTVLQAADLAGIGGDHRTLWFTGTHFNLLTRLARGVEYVRLLGAGLFAPADGSAESRLEP